MDEGRRRFLAERREATVRRYDTLHSADYDERWGAVSPTHARFVRRLTELVPRHGEVLDVGCGTGKYWPRLLAAGLRVVGVDQSRGMLDVARRKHPEVPTRRLALQDLAAAGDLRGRFDGLCCVDVLEFVGPEDWPGVAAGLASVLRVGAPGYLTVELRPDDLTAPSDPRLVDGEDVGEDGGYHYHPAVAQAEAWLHDAGLAVQQAAEGDHYWHALVRRAG